MHQLTAPSTLLPLTEGLRRLGLRRGRYYDWAKPSSPRHKKDLPPPIKIGASVFFLEEDVEKFIRTHIHSAGN